MSDEFTITTNVKLANDDSEVTIAPGAIQMDQNAIGLHAPIVVVSTSEEDMETGDVGVHGLLVLRNLDANNFVKYGPNNGGSMVEMGRLKPGDPDHIIRLGPTVDIRWVADTAACKVQMWLFED